MLVIVTVIVLSIIILVSVVLDKRVGLSFGDIVLALVVSLLCGFVADGIVMGFTNDDYIESKSVTKLVETREIVALKDVNNEEGEFFLGCGSVGTESYYAYYYEGEHGFTPDKIKLYDEHYPVYLNYTTGKEKPRVEEYYTTNVNVLVEKPGYKSIIAGLLLGRHNVGDELGPEWDTGLNGSSDTGYYKIYVPENTIKENYNIDLQ